MQVTIMQGTHRFLSEHKSDMAALFDRRPGKFVLPIAPLTSFELSSLIDLLENAELSEGPLAVYGTEYLVSLRQAWTDFR